MIRHLLDIVPKPDTQILVRDGLIERPSPIGPTHYIFFKILQVGIKNEVSKHLRY